MAETDAELDAYVAVWNAITPAERPTPTSNASGGRDDPRRLYLLAELDGDVVGCGFAGPSQSEGRGFLSPSVLPDARRRGVGDRAAPRADGAPDGLGFVTASAHVTATTPARSRSHGASAFEEVDRQVEQVRTSAGGAARVVPDGVDGHDARGRPELLGESYALATEGYEDMATSAPVSVTLRRLALRGRRERPGGHPSSLSPATRSWASPGLCRNADGGYEDGLSVVRRGWRRRGLAEALKREKLAWAAANGVDGDRYLDADRQRGHARAQRAARVRLPQRQHHRPGRSPGRLRPRRARRGGSSAVSSRSTSSTSSRWRST